MKAYIIEELSAGYEYDGGNAVGMLITPDGVTAEEAHGVMRLSGAYERIRHWGDRLVARARYRLVDWDEAPVCLVEQVRRKSQTVYFWLFWYEEEVATARQLPQVVQDFISKKASYRELKEAFERWCGSDNGE